MALDAFVDSTSLNNNLISIADTIRTKREQPSTTKLTFSTDFITEINSISSGGSVKDTNIISSTSPGTYAGTYFNSNIAGYIAITKDYSSTNGLKTYVYSIQDIVNL